MYYLNKSEVVEVYLSQEKYMFDLYLHKNWDVF